MKVKTVTFGLSATIPLENYENLKPMVSMTGEVEAHETPQQALDDLHEIVVEKFSALVAEAYQAQKEARKDAYK